MCRGPFLDLGPFKPLCRLAQSGTLSGRLKVKGAKRVPRKKRRKRLLIKRFAGAFKLNIP